MEMNVSTVNFATTPAIRDFTERRLRAALGRLMHHVRAVSARLAVTAHRGRLSPMKCQLAVKLADGRQVIIREQGFDLYGAITSAAHRARRAVQKTIDRRRAILDPISASGQNLIT